MIKAFCSSCFTVGNVATNKYLLYEIWTRFMSISHNELLIFFVLNFWEAEKSSWCCQKQNQLQKADCFVNLSTLAGFNFGIDRFTTVWNQKGSLDHVMLPPAWSRPLHVMEVPRFWALYWRQTLFYGTGILILPKWTSKTQLIVYASIRCQLVRVLVTTVSPVHQFHQSLKCGSHK